MAGMSSMNTVRPGVRPWRSRISRKICACGLSIFSRAEITLNNAARLLVDDLHMAQARSSYTHTPIEFVFLPNGEGYYTLDASDSVLPSERVPRKYSADAIFEGVEIIDRRLGSQTTLVFDANGHANTDVSITLSFSGHTRTVALRKRDSIAFLADAVRGR